MAKALEIWSLDVSRRRSGRIRDGVLPNAVRLIGRHDAARGGGLSSGPAIASAKLRTRLGIGERRLGHDRFSESISAPTTSEPVFRHQRPEHLAGYRNPTVVAL